MIGSQYELTQEENVNQFLCMWPPDSSDQPYTTLYHCMSIAEIQVRFASMQYRVFTVGCLHFAYAMYIYDKF